jgi:hypothetical protein
MDTQQFAADADVNRGAVAHGIVLSLIMVIGPAHPPPLSSCRLRVLEGVPWRVRDRIITAGAFWFGSAAGGSQ